MPPFEVRFLVALFVAALVSACAGGPGKVVPTPPKSISGVAMLGPVAGADVAISGTAGVLGSGTTREDGSFGPISYSGSYNGPLRIEVTGNAASTWTCDLLRGCGSGLVFYQPGDGIEFDATLEAVVPAAADGQFVSVSMLSNLAARRLDVLGSLSTPNVNTANADIADLVRLVLGGIFDDLTLELPDDFISVELFDLQGLPAPGDEDDALSMLLTLLNSGLMGLVRYPQTTGEFIDLISDGVSMQPELPISQPGPFTASQESFLTMLIGQAIEARNVGGPTADTINALLSPNDLNVLANSVGSALASLPGLWLGRFDLDVFVNDQSLENPILRELAVLTNTSAQLQPSDYDVRVSARDGGEWLSATTVSIDGTPHVRLDFDREQVQALPNAIHEAFLETYSTTGEFRRHHLRVRLHLSFRPAGGSRSDHYRR